MDQRGPSWSASGLHPDADQSCIWIRGGRVLQSVHRNSPKVEGHFKSTFQNDFRRVEVCITSALFALWYPRMLCDFNAATFGINGTWARKHRHLLAAQQLNVYISRLPKPYTLKQNSKTSGKTAHTMQTKNSKHQ